MRRAAGLLICAAPLLAPSTAAAYRLQPHTWHSRTLTYYDQTGRYGAEIRAAAQAWNRSGARVSLRPAARGSARVVIRVRPGMHPLGLAVSRVENGIAVKATIYLNARLKRFDGPAAKRSMAAAVVIAHEFGHVLGLAHEDRRCATMNSSLWEGCGFAPEPWRYRCRILERDDVRGLVRRYGGRVRAVGPEFCFAEPAPRAPAQLAAAPVAGAVQLTWRMPARDAARAQLLRSAGPCGAASPRVVAVLDGRPGTALAFVDTPPRGTYCYTVVPLGRLGRPGTPASIAHTVLGELPVARFAAYADGPLTAAFLDQSFDLDGTIVAWRWDFGDGTGSTEQEPRHTYAAPGVYQVTLTVTDDSGQSRTATQTVTAVSH